MMKRGSTIFALTLLLGIILQVVFVYADKRSTPSKTAVGFSKAYFQLDPSMSDFLCSEFSEEEGDIADEIIWQASEEARMQGFDARWAKSVLFDVDTHIIHQDDENAVVRVTAKRKKSIHPAYTVVAKIFNLGQTGEVNETIELIRENGRWKVCGATLPLAGI